MAVEPLTFMFRDDGTVPNNPALPLIVYRGGVDLAAARDPESTIEQIFMRNGWGHGLWRNGIYPFLHYHSRIHEALGIARGTARVRFGGAQGEEVEVKAGDVAVLPAGTGHQKLSGSADLRVIGGYPAGGSYNLCRGGESEHAQALESIPRVPLPQSDPLLGEQGPLHDLWRVEAQHGRIARSNV
jgi:uncharacterized protein YjlB